VPVDKKLSPAWVKALSARGEHTVYRGAELDKIGMPVGGICAGQVYLGGDGRLWHWDVFNQIANSGTAGPHYAKPLTPSAPFDQGFAVRTPRGGRAQTRPLDRKGFAEVTFRGESPIGYVESRDDKADVAVTLEAFSPFLPLNADDSGLP